MIILESYLENIKRNAQEITTSRDATTDIADAAAAIIADVDDILGSTLDLQKYVTWEEQP